MIIHPHKPEPPQSDPALQMLTTPKERLDFYRREIFNETGNLANRTNAYLTAQSFLVIAYASCMANSNPHWGELFTLVVPTTLAVFGILSSFSAWPGIKAACDIIDHWYAKQSGLLQHESAFGQAYDEFPLFSDWESTFSGQRKSLAFSKRSPWLFCGFWIFLGFFALWIQIPTLG
ncbi:hypothetical protein EF096_03575 [Pseudomonas neustonica]|uniref:SMODS and SLOG-associating 2TM effector domain-containing protein n=2 Tax=Pseudomonas TaxID=286 RepID=A0ABX9XPZ3_9PSED|nr:MULTISPECIES: hypothetical protein [Pseudomonas]ROZ86229.1 hypothetical protein EF099_03980 [Pseudomonas sp. SSM44]ROZ87954.1 hypothetical protein EF096_03575 [Pseudomonas neustonica]